MRFGQARHEIDRLRKEVIDKINFFMEPERNSPVKAEDFNETLRRIKATADRAFEDVVCNLDHLENTVVESIVEHVAKAYIEGKYGQGSSQVAP
ncbi:MAG: hypothetical protein M0R80_23590 [Proteobacteria bacterium]|jgi:hypothetical protein|nr:hypothetical protein [Pseudomonadota bacterium]